jgi:hypothetical protein
MDGTTKSPKHLGRIIIILLLIGVATGVLVVGLRGQRESRARRVVLTDGTQVEFLGTSVGSTNFTTETKWQQMARTYLPRRFQNWLPPITSGNCGSGSNSVAVYLSVSNSSGTNLSSLPWNYYVTEDETGFRYPHEGGYCSFGGYTSPKIYGFTLRAYPRREKEFLFHLMDSKGVVMGSLRVPNPLFGAFPEWKPLPLPQTQTNGPVILTLQGLREQKGDTWCYIDPKWHLEATDPAWVKAQPRSQILEDSTGNSGQSLSLREGAWKLHTAVYRKRVEDFTPSEQLVVTNLAVPSAGNFVSVDQSAECAGVRINLLVLAGAGTITISNGVARSMSPTVSYSNSSSSDGRNRTESWGRSTSFLLVETTNTQEGDEIEVHVRDENGKEIKVESNGYSGRSGGIRTYGPGFKVPDGVKSLSVQIIVNRPLPFDFMVNPKDVVRKK